MMALHKTSVCALTVLLASVHIFGEESQPNNELQRLEHFYYVKCHNNSNGHEAFNRLRSNVYEMYKYFDYAIDYLPKETNQFCNDQRTNLVSRIGEIVPDLEKCLAKDEKFLADFLKMSFEEFLHFLCHNKGEFSRNYFRSTNNKCRETILVLNSDELGICLNRIFSPTKKHLTKADMCDAYTVTKRCFAKLLETACPTSYDMMKLNEIFFEYISKPCSSATCLTKNIYSFISMIILLKYTLY